MSSKKRLLFTLLSIILTSCHESWTGTPVTYCMPEGGVVFSVVESGSNQIVGTMQFLPLKEKEISIRFEFDKVSDISFVFTYRSDLFEVARQKPKAKVYLPTNRYLVTTLTSRQRTAFTTSFQK